MVIDAVENIFSAELSFVPLFNLALQQNALPVIYELKLINNTGSDIDDLQCRFSASRPSSPEQQQHKNQLEQRYRRSWLLYLTFYRQQRNL